MERLGAALRGTFIIDPDGLVRAYSVQDLTVGRSVDEILRLVSALKTGELTPVGWRPGEPFIPPIPKNTGKCTSLVRKKEVVLCAMRAAVGKSDVMIC